MKIIRSVVGWGQWVVGQETVTLTNIIIIIIITSTFGSSGVWTQGPHTELHLSPLINFLRQDFAKLSKQDLNLWSSYLSLPSTALRLPMCVPPCPALRNISRAGNIPYLDQDGFCRGIIHQCIKMYEFYYKLYQID